MSNDPAATSPDTKLRVGFLAGRSSYPPSGGNSVHIYQVWHRLQKMGYSLHTWGEQAIPGRHEYPRTAGGFADMVENIDLLYMRFPFESDIANESVARVLFRRKLPLVCEFNCPIEEFTHQWEGRTFYALRQWLWLQARNQVLMRTRVDHAICVSKAMARYARSRFGVKNVTFMANAGDPEHFDPDLREQGRRAMGLGDDEFVVFWAGSTEYFWSGFGQTVDAARLMDGSGVRFVIAGDKRYLPPSLPDGFLALGTVSYLDMPKFVAAADVCLCLYNSFDWCSVGYYGSPTKLFAYMASGRPVIASDMGQIRDLVRQEGVGCLTDGGPEDIAEKIDLLRRDPVGLHAMGRAARRAVVSKYNWQNNADRTHAIITGVMSRYADRG